ncbi:MAG: fibronectin type III domain-containing protein, partial [Phaeodactylibacter sp.]|nr:fibronectin type III domain-containing protein [Phaeodactylibacter sp.]
LNPHIIKNLPMPTKSIHLLLLLFWLPGFCGLEAQVPISEARLEALGTTVTVRGVALNGQELGVVRYLQDPTGGIAIYPGTGSVDGFEYVEAGDSITVTGQLVDFNGLLEISPVTAFTIHSVNNPLPSPKLITSSELGEAVEGQLVKLECASFGQTGSFQGNTLYNLGHYSGANFNLYLGSNHPLGGSSIPSAAVDLVGIASQYNSYQLLIRDVADLATSLCFFILDGPKLTDLTTNSLSFSWTTNDFSSTNVRWGTTPAMEHVQEQSNSTLSHEFTIEDLDPATFYYVQVYSDNGQEQVMSAPRLYSTASNSSGLMEVYFNKSTDPSYSTGPLPNGVGPDVVEAFILSKIEAAQHSIDITMYNTTRDWLVDALEEAVDRGVQVRYIADDQTGNSALSPTPDFPVLYGNSGGALMHNKFMVFDANATADAYVITGSLNLTFGNVFEQFNNVVGIQDEALAKAFTLEFEEMWGSSGPEPNFAEARFGDEKTSNTPQQFKIGDTWVECYFSPSDQTTARIREALETADETIDFALLLLTMDELAIALKDAYFDLVDVRGLVNSGSEPSSDFYFLQAQGLEIYENWLFDILHHKYAIVDAHLPDSDPLVITGSHNWTFSAETQNDENTLIIHNADIANIYLQEFEARWQSIVSTEESHANFSVKVFPNPADAHLFLSGVPEGAFEELRLIDLLGRVQWTGAFQPSIPTQPLNAGLYWLQLCTAAGQWISYKVQVQH